MHQQIIKLEDVPEAGAVRADFFGREVLVTRVNGRPRAYLDVCPHFGGPLELQGDGFVCGRHQAEFGLDGRCQRGPARADSRLIVLPTRVIDDVVTYVYEAPEGTPGAHEDEVLLDQRLQRDA